MTQYEIQNAIFAIDGYYVPRAGESPASAFLRAKVEAQNALKDRVAHIEAITFQRWEAARDHAQPVAAPDWAVLGPRLADALLGALPTIEDEAVRADDVGVSVAFHEQAAEMRSLLVECGVPLA